MEIPRIKIKLKFLLIFAGLFIFAAPHAHAGTLAKPASSLGLITYFSFDEATGTVATDFSGNNHTGTLTNMSAPSTATSGWNPGKLGKAVTFDGTDDRVSFNDVTLTNSHTVSMWIYSIPNAGNTYQTLFADDGGTIGWYYMNDTSQLNFYYSGDHKQTSTIPKNTWTHLVIVDNAGTITFYMNGIADGTFGSAPGYTAGQIGDATSGERFFGSVDEVRVYNRALSSAEIANLYKVGVIKLNSSQNNLVKNGLVGWWTFDGADFTDKVYDRSGQGGNGYVYLQATSSSKIAAKIGQGISFNGSTGFVQLNASSIANSSFSVSGWIYQNVGGSDQTWFSMGTGGCAVNACLHLRIIANGAIRFGFYGNDVDSSASLVTTGMWHHLAYTYDVTSGTRYIYLDGVQVATDTAAPAYSGTTATYIGRFGGTANEYFNGKVDDVRLYNRALTANEVKVLYSAANGKINSSQNVISGSSLQSGLVGLWSFNGPDLTDKVYDRSGQGNNGYFYGPATSSAKINGKLGQGLLLDGSTGYVRMATFTGSASTMTFCTWIKTSYAGADQFILNINRNAGNIVNEGVLKIVTGTGVLRFWDYTGAAYGFADGGSDGATNVADGKWHHVCFVKNGTSGTYYVDGVSDGNISALNNITYGSSDWIIGRDYRAGSASVRGTLDEVRIYNRALSASEVKQLYLYGK